MKKKSHNNKMTGNSKHLFMLILNDNRLNFSMTGHRMVGWIKEQDLTICPQKMHISLTKTNINLG
jgi:hypothetical protein